MRQFRELSRFLLCFFIGIIAGTTAANWLADWWQGAPELMEHYLLYRVGASQQAWEIRLIQLAPQRLVIPVILLVIARSHGAKKTFSLLTVAAGMLLSGQIAWLTCIYGYRGIVVFLLLTLPQWIGYVPVWCVIAWGDSKSFQRREKVLILGWYLLGMIAEVTLNPFFINFI